MQGTMENQPVGTLFGKIAEELRQAIRKGVYREGDRLPSLRRICGQYKVSLGTAVEAYGRLQVEGWVLPRDRSGFYVSSNEPLHMPGPSPVTPQSAPVEVKLGRLAISILADARRPGVHHLGAGIPGPALLPLQRLSRAISRSAREASHTLGSFEDIRGMAGLRRQIARLMAEAGVACSPEEIIVTNGCQEALTLALQSVTEPGATIVVESPTFFGILQVAEALHLKVLELPVQYPRGICPDTLMEVVRAQRISACILTPTINNPVGVVMPDEDKKRIAEFLASESVPLIEDDIFGSLSFSAPRPKAARSFDASGNTMLCSSFSKSLAPGMRIGWILPGRFMEQVEYRKFLANISTAGLPQQALGRLLEQRTFRLCMRRVTESLQLRMAQMRTDIAAHFPQGTHLTDPQGGLFLWVELPDRLDSTVLYKRALQRGVSILPGAMFSANGDYGHYLRLNYATEKRETIREAIKTLASLLLKLPPTQSTRRN